MQHRPPARRTAAALRMARAASVAVRPAETAGAPALLLLGAAPRTVFDGGHDFLLRGAVADGAARVTRVGLHLAGREVAAAAVAYGAGGDCAFALTVRVLSAALAAPLAFDLVASGEAGELARAGYAVETDPGDAGEAVLRAATPDAGIGTLPDCLPPPVILRPERCVVDAAGRLQVGGWVLARGGLDAVEVFAGGELLGLAQVRGRRDDVAALHPGYPDAALSGFAFAAPLPHGAGAGGITLQARGRDGAAATAVLPLRLAAREAATAAGPDPGAGADALDPERMIHPYCDAATLSIDGRLELSGWAVCARGISEVAVFLDGRRIGAAELGRVRADVAERHPGVAQARRSGFAYATRVAERITGAHQLAIVAANALGDSRTLLLTLGAHDAGQLQPHDAAATPDVVADMDGDVRLMVENPALAGAHARDPMAGQLVIEGWALARSGIARVDVSLDGGPPSRAHLGLGRRDVRDAFPDWPGALRSGFILRWPAHALPAGDHLVLVRAEANDGAILTSRFGLQVLPDPGAAADGGRPASRSLTALGEDALRRLDCRARFLLAVPLAGAADAAAAARTLASLRAQSFADWELLLVTSQPDAAVRLLDGSADDAGGAARVVRPAGLDQAIRRAAASPQGGRVLVGALCPGDTLAPDALLQVALAAGLHPHAEFLYADEERTDPARGVRAAFLKPGWSPDLLLSTNYVGRPWFADAALLHRAGVTARLLAEQGQYECVLRCTEQARGIEHIPLLLGQSCDTARDAAGDDAAGHRAAERAALRRAMARRGIAGDLLDGRAPGSYRVRRRPGDAGLVSIIIPTCGVDDRVRACIDSIHARTAYRDFEIVCIDNIPPGPSACRSWIRRHADRVVSVPGAFNWSRFNNQAARAAGGDYLLFLNDDVEIEHEDWLDALLEHAQRPEVGVVGARLLYPDRTVQHAGIFLTALGTGRHAFRYLAEADAGYFGLATVQREVSAVTGACMMVPAGLFRALGGFDERHSIVNNDVDFCLRAGRAGRHAVFTPHAQLIHHELASRAGLRDEYDRARFAGAWRSLYAAGDRFHNPGLAKGCDDLRPDAEPLQAVCAPRPLFERARIQRILAVKLDHIGDLVTALPALRRLRSSFPHARLSLLAGKSAASLPAVARLVDEIIPFEFFHARSELGANSLDDAALSELRQRLAPHRFDLAVDLRKQTDTRPILRQSGARWLAGYDHQGRFPWLDVALEWEGDASLQRKRTHVGDDLLRLVDAVALAAEADDAADPGDRSDGARLTFLPARVRAKFARPVAIIHPGAGSRLKQWPVEHFAALIVLLAERNQMQSVLIGGADEAALAASVIKALGRRRCAVSLAGAVSLADLPALLGAGALFVGNDSGPKHIAASLGVPTIGIHSGAVDAVEWGPAGPRAVALQRRMSCSPCYLSKAEDCSRGLACLTELEPREVHRYCELLLARAATRPAVAETVLPRQSSQRRGHDASRRTTDHMQGEAD